MNPERRGFTLIELIAAMTITALVIAGAQLLLGALSESAERTSRMASVEDEHASAARWLRDLIANSSASGDTAFVFAGWSREMRFDSWCDSPYGGEERCRATLRIGGAEQEGALTIAVGDGQPMRLRTRGRPAGLTYLERTDANEEWRSEWGSSLHAPAAVGIVVDDDTLVFGIKRSP